MKSNYYRVPPVASRPGLFYDIVRLRLYDIVRLRLYDIVRLRLIGLYGCGLHTSMHTSQPHNAQANVFARPSLK